MISTGFLLRGMANTPHSIRYPYIPQDMNNEETENYIKINKATRQSKFYANSSYLWLYSD